MNPQEIRDRMERLEMTPDRERDVITAAREILRLPADQQDALHGTFSAELWRTTVLCRTQYAPSVAVLPSEAVMMAAMLQGLTMAAAILEPALNAARRALPCPVCQAALYPDQETDDGYLGCPRCAHLWRVGLIATEPKSGL